MVVPVPQQGVFDGHTPYLGPLRGLHGSRQPCRSLAEGDEGRQCGVRAACATARIATLRVDEYEQHLGRSGVWYPGGGGDRQGAEAAGRGRARDQAGGRIHGIV